MEVRQAERLARVRAQDQGARVLKHHASGAIMVRYRQPWQKGWHRHGRNMPISSSGDLTRYVYVILPDGRLIGYTNINPERLTQAEQRHYADALASITRPTKATKTTRVQATLRAKASRGRRTPSVPTGRPHSPRSEHPSIERAYPERAGTAEYIIPVSERRKARRREAALVRRYEAYLDHAWIAHERLAMRVDEVRRLNDIYVADRHQLIEAKAGVSRQDARMAIGQVKDYLFQIRRGELFKESPRSAILFPEKPRDSIIELLDSLDIGTIWEEERGFVDNRGGEFTH